MICTECGALFNREDKHICKPENKPSKGKEKIPTTSEVAITQ